MDKRKLKRAKICEICGESDSSILEIHHIISRSRGGSNHPSNLCYICCNCHCKVHNGDIILEGRYNSTSGNILIWRRFGDGVVIKEMDIDSVYLVRR